MKTRRLGRTDLQITPLGLGAWAIGGGGWAFGWGPQDDADSVAAIYEALDLGFNWIDTAAVYGLGHSEEVVARAVAGMAAGQKPYLFTKCGRVWGDDREIGKNIAPESIRRECEASLKRLRVQCIDLYQIHWPEPPEDIEAEWDAMVALKRAGKVRHIGLSNFSVEQMERLGHKEMIASLQPPYSLIRREVEADVLPYCRTHDIGVIAYSPMGSGLLTGAWSRERVAALPPDDWRREKAKGFREPHLTRNLNLAELLRQIGLPHDKTPGEVALAWVLRHPAISGAIVGARKPGQLRELAAAASFDLSGTEVARIEQYFLNHPAPAG